MKTKIIIVFLMGKLIISCTNNTERYTEKNQGLIEISKAQFESEKMELGEPAFYPFAKKVHFTGKVIPTIMGQAQISLPMPGIIENIRCKPSQMIKKDAVLFEISGHWFIDLQKDLSESSAILSKLKGDYLRAKELYTNTITTEKEFTAAESNYYAANANYKAIKTKIESMGLDVSKIEKGDFYQSFPIKSPINGFVSKITATLGQYIEPQQTIAEIIDNNSFQLKLYVFEKDFETIKNGQPVEFYLNTITEHKYQATLNAVGKTIMPDSRSIECYATILNPENLNLVSNQFVEGDIFASLDTVLAVPETAIINSENEQYLLMLEKEESVTYYFNKIEINTGRKANNYIELTGQKPLKRVLLSGTYNIVIE